jgi:WD40 repeat protein
MGTLRAVKVVRRDHFESDRPYEREFAGIQRYEPVSRSSGGLVHLLHMGRNDHEGYFYYVMELADRRSDEWRVTSDELEKDAPQPTEHASLVTHPSSLDASYASRTLRSDIKRRHRLPVAECLRLALDVVSGLSQLHRHGLVHRDVKPSNIIFVNSRAKLADIGLVTTHGEGRTFVGTEGYIPPEGPGTRVADLYALGVVLYQASTGYSPERFPDVPPEWLSDTAGDDALEFHEIILKACEGQHERRYQNAEEMQADLALLQSGQSIRKVRALARRYARLRVVGFVGSALLVGTIGIALLADYRARVAAESRAREIALREDAENSLARAEAAEQESQQQLYAALLEQARATVLTRELGQRVRALDAVRRAGVISNSTVLRGVAVSALALPDLGDHRDWPVPPETTLGQLDPAFERVALASGEGPVEIRAVSDRRLLATLPASTNRAAYVANWSPDGRFLAVKRDLDPGGQRIGLEIWDVAAARRALLLQEVTRGAFGFHPRLPRLIVGGLPATAVIWNLETAGELSRHPIGGEAALVRFSPDGEHFAALHASDETWAITIHAAGTGAPLRSQRFADVTPDAASDFAWQPKSRWIAVSDRTGTVRRWDWETGEIQVLGRHKAEAVMTVFSPRGEYLFTGGWERELICWDLRAMRRAFTMGLNSFTLQFASDGLRCATWQWPDKGLGLHTIETPALCREFADDLGGGRNFAAFSPDGRWLAACGGERVLVRDLDGAGANAVVDEPVMRRLGFTPQGELLGSRIGMGFRWRIKAAPNPDAPLTLERLELADIDGLVSLCLLTNGVAFTGTRGSTLTGFDQLATANNFWNVSIDGLNGASPDGRWLGMFRSHTAELHVHRLPGLEPVTVLTNESPISMFEFSPRGDELAVATRSRGIEFWSTATWRRTRQLPNFTAVLYSPDGLTFWLTTDYRLAGLYDVRSVEPLLPLPADTLPLALSPDGRHLAASVNARHLQVWDLVALRQRLRELGLDWLTK